MDNKMVWRVLIALVFVAGIVGVGLYEYRLGVAYGIATSGKLPAGTPALYPYPFWGFHPFGFLFPLLFFVLIFGLGRRLFWRGWGCPHGWRRDISSPDLEEWHKQAHEKMSQQRS